MIRKPFVGKKVVIDNFFCCGGFRRGTRGVITAIGRKPQFFLVQKEGEKTNYWHCNQCVNSRR